MRRAASWAAQITAWCVILGVALVLAVAVLIPRLAGATPYTILTGSMEPGLPPGTMVVVRPIDPEDVGVGSVITYQLHSGKPTVVTHRVVSKGFTAGGDPVLWTQGDANDVVDEAPVQPVQIRGELWYAVPLLGHVNTLLSGHQRQVAVYVVASGLLGYAAFMFAGSLRDRSRAREATT